MSDRGKIVYQSKWYSYLPLKIYENGIETIYFRSRGFLYSIHYQIFRFADEIEAIYPFEWFSLPILIGIPVKGIQIETIQNEVGLIFYNHYPKDWDNIIIPHLKKMFGDKWDNIFHSEDKLTKRTRRGKIGEYAIHHNWKYYGLFKDWM